MNRRLAELQLTRGRLLERIAGQRREIARSVAPLASALGATDRAYGMLSRVVAYVRAHPSIPVLAVTALFVLRTRRTLRWARRGFLAWQSWKALRARLPFAWTHR